MTTLRVHNLRGSDVVPLSHVLRQALHLHTLSLGLERDQQYAMIPLASSQQILCLLLAAPKSVQSLTLRLSDGALGALGSENFKALGHLPALQSLNLELPFNNLQQGTSPPRPR